MRCARHLQLTTLAVVMSAVSAAAQPPPKTPIEPPLHCSSLEVYGGVSTAESNVGGLAGGAAGWQFTPWFGLEGSAFWLDRPGSEAGFSAGINARWTLVRHRRALPFVKAGVGIYHASFDADDPAMPAFYRNRFEGSSAPMAGQRTFTDPAVKAGGGMDIRLARRVSLRPQGEAMFVLDQGQSRVMPAFTLHLAFHFDEHPITPARR